MPRTLCHLTSCLVLISLLAVAGCRSAKRSRTNGGAEKARPSSITLAAADPRERVIAPLIARILQRDHLRDQPLDDRLSDRAFDSYLSALDPAKQLLLRKHTAQLVEYRTQIDDQMKSGKLTLAHAGAGLMQARLETIRKLVASLLAKPFDFSRDETLQTDADKRHWAETERELAELWRKSLKLEVLTRMRRMTETLKSLKKAEQATRKKSTKKSEAAEPREAGDKGIAALRRAAAKIPATDDAREAKARSDLAKRYDGRLTRLAAAEPLDGATALINAVTRQYDPHTAYLAPATKENFDINMSGSLEGIGAVLSEDEHYIRVERLVAGGASWRQGELEAGDLIIAVAQADGQPVDVVDVRLQRVVAMIRGPKGTVVSLTVKKPDDRIKVITITRDVVKIEAAYARGAVVAAQGGAKLGYVYLPSFYGNIRDRRGMTPKRRATIDVRQILTRFARRKVSGVILDLRGNGGGLLGDARDISGLFLDVGPIVQTHGRTGAVDVLSDTDRGAVHGGPLVVMVDRDSASASEIVAGALQDYGRAVIVGAGATFGKGTVQVIVGLDRMLGKDAEAILGVLKLTRHQFFRVSGASTQLRGVEPDVHLVDPTAYVKSGERRLDNALPWSEVRAVAFTRWPGVAWKIESLREASAKRQASSAFFGKLRDRIGLLKAQREQTEVPLKRSSWLAWVDKRRKALEQVTPESDKAAPLLSVEPIVYSKSLPERRRNRSTRAARDPSQRWKDSVSRDHWLAEAVQVLAEMVAARP